MDLSDSLPTPLISPSGRHWERGPMAKRFPFLEFRIGIAL